MLPSKLGIWLIDIKLESATRHSDSRSVECCYTREGMASHYVIRLQPNDHARTTPLDRNNKVIQELQSMEKLFSIFLFSNQRQFI